MIDNQMIIFDDRSILLNLLFRSEEVKRAIIFQGLLSTKVRWKWDESNSFFFFFNFFFPYFIYLFLAVLGLQFVRGLSPVAASGGHSSLRCGDRSSSRCAGLSLSRPLPLRGTGSRRAGSAAVAHGPSRSTACGIFPDQGSNPCPLH